MQQSHFIFWMLSLFISGAVIFLNGFFPAAYEKIAATSEKLIERPRTLDGLPLSIPKKEYDQVIFMIIDALRNDFANNESMPIAVGNACYKSSLHVDTPTVTMPRIKTMMTGTVSNFIDIIFNLGHVSKVDESLLHQLRKMDQNIVFSGDDTWIKLFAGEMARHEANNDSLFVHDFYEGDKKIGKFLEKEIKRNDWNLLILHYLGLDHIGHVEGSNSPKMPLKLKEMDDQVELILKSNDFKNRILILTSDHGMRNGGGHGGSSAEETTVPLLIFSGNCQKKLFSTEKYNQIDICPTLAAIFSIEIPNNSIGCLIPELLNNYNFEDQLYMYYYNALHLMHQFAKKNEHGVRIEFDIDTWFKDAKNAHKSFLISKRSNAGTSTFMFEKAKSEYMRVSEKISKELAKSMVKFDYILITIGLSIVVLTTIYTLLCVIFDPNQEFLVTKLIEKRTLLLNFVVALVFNMVIYKFELFSKSSLFTSFLLSFPLAVAINLCFKISNAVIYICRPMKAMSALRLGLSLPLPYVGLFAFHTLSLCSSSYIEEEHQTWYYLGSTMLILTFIVGFWKRVRKASNKPNVNLVQNVGYILTKMKISMIMLMFLALMRRLNQTGNKWAHLPDFKDYLNEEQHKKNLTIFVLFALLNIVMTLKNWLKASQMTGAILATVFIYCFRGLTGNIIFFSKDNLNPYSVSLVMWLFWLCIAVVVLEPYRNIIKTQYQYILKTNLTEILHANLSAFLLISALLHKPHNIVLVPSLTFTLRVAYKLIDMAFCESIKKKDKSYNLVQKTLTTVFLANMFYFYQGNSNSLSTIDLNPGYLGQTSYDPLHAGLFIILNTYSAHIIAFLFLVVHMFETQIQQLPQRQEKEQHSTKFIVETSDKDLNLVLSLYTVILMLQIAFYLCLFVSFRYHLFIYSVFAPKAFYVCFSILVFYINFCLTKLYLNLFKF